MAQETHEGLVRGIRRWDLVALVINGIIGAGILGLPSRAYALVGTYSLLAFVACALFASLLILCFAEVSSRFTETGGPYRYAREAFGPRAGFVVGWLMWLTRLTAFGSILNLLVTYLGHFWPGVTLEPWRSIAVTVVVVGFTTVNLIGVRETALVSDVFAVAKLVPLVLFVVVGWFFVEPQRLSLGEPPDAESFSRAVLLLVFAFGGFESSTINAGEVRDPRRDFPYALFTAMAVVVALYLSIQAVSIGTLPGLAASERPVADAAQRFLGPPGAALIALGAVVSMAGTLNATTLAATRLPFAMAADGAIPRVFTATHRRFRTPHVSIVVSSAAVLLVTLTQTFVSALTISTISRVIVYGVTCACVLVLRRHADRRPAAFTTPGGALVPVATLLLCVWLVSNSPWREARDLGLAVAAGLAIHFVYIAVRRGARAAPASEQRPEPEAR